MATATKSQKATPVKSTGKAPKPKDAAVELIAFPTADEIAAMGQVERIAACKPERAALAAWKAAGRQGDRPLTPIMSWMENPTVARKARAKSARAEFVRDPDKQTELTNIILRERPLGTSWNKIAKLLEAAEIPSSARGCQWFNKTAYSAAQRLGLVEAGENLNRRHVPKAAAPVKATATKKAAAKKTTAAKSTKSTARKAPGQRPAVKAAAAKAKTTPATKGLANLLKIK